MTQPDGRIEANGVNFAFLRQGPPDGPLALCLHGFPDHAPTFRALLADLAAAGFDAVAPWMRGYAPTAVPADGRYQSAVLAQDAISLAGALAPDKPAVLIGHDWGAIAAYVAAAAAPDRFRRLVTMAVPHMGAVGAALFTLPAQLKRSWYIFFFQTAFAEIALPAADFALIDTLWRDWSPGLVPDPAFMADLKATLAAPGGTDAALGYYRAILQADRQAPELAAMQALSFAPVPIPTLYLHGADDGCMGAELVDRGAIAPFFPAGIDVDVVATTGHFLHLEAPSEVNRRIVDFVTAR